RLCSRTLSFTLVLLFFSPLALPAVSTLFPYTTLFRSLMTILGVAGCTGLLVMGFGIRDSLHGIGNIQYSEVQKNDVIAFKNRHVNTTERQKLNKIFTSHDVTQTTAVQYQQLTKHLDSTGATENVMLIAPQSTKN